MRAIMERIPGFMVQQTAGFRKVCFVFNNGLKNTHPYAVESHRGAPKYHAGTLGPHRVKTPHCI